MKRREDYVRTYVLKALRMVDKMRDGDEYLEPVVCHFPELKNKELEEIYSDLGHILPFLVWVNVRAGLRQERIFKYFFSGAFADSKFIRSEEILEMLRTLKNESLKDDASGNDKISRGERSVAESILKKKPLPRLSKNSKPLSSFGQGNLFT